MTPGGRLLIWRAIVVPDRAATEPGTLMSAGPGTIAVATGTGLLLPIEVQPENRRAMPWDDFLRGARLAPGARFSDIGPSTPPR